MDIPEHVQRIWRIQNHDGSEQCIGAVSDWPGPELSAGEMMPNYPIVAVANYVRVGPPHILTIDGRASYVRLVDGDTRSQEFPCETVHEALTWLEDYKRMMVASGWVEISLDAIGDPD